QNDVRLFSNHLLKRVNRASPFPPPPTAEDLAAFNRRRIGGPTRANFTLDLNAYRFKSPWNLAAAEVFAELYLSQRSRVTDDRDFVIHVFLRHLRDLRDQYRDLQILELPSDDERRIAMAERDAKKTVHSRRYGVRMSTVHRRRAVAQTLHPSLKKYVSLIDKMTVDGMSDDELDPESGIHQKWRIIRLVWRSNMLNALMHSLDGLHNYSRYSLENKMSPGQPPRDRRVSSLVDDKRQAPIGLPENCYDEGWLAGLTAIERAQLR
ncbi:hypothetical protein K474DRAFT_1578951, partial [Panus rudis PR-1116 ss-1]